MYCTVLASIISHNDSYMYVYNKFNNRFWPAKGLHALEHPELLVWHAKVNYVMYVCASLLRRPWDSCELDVVMHSQIAILLL